ncbi:hypothetical protein LINPERPRIM_LOCUS38671 [Linum perenne]
MGTEYSPTDLQRAMEEINSDKDGFINMEELAQLSDRRPRPEPRRSFGRRLRR